MKISNHQVRTIFDVINKYDTSDIIDNDTKNVVFSNAWSPIEFDKDGRYSVDLPGARMIKVLLSKDGHDITHGTRLDEIVTIVSGFTNSTVKGQELWDAIEQNINLNPGITTIVGFLGAMKTLLSHYLDDIYRGDYNFVSLPFKINDNHSWFHLFKEIEVADTEGGSHGLTQYLSWINLLEKGSYIGCLPGDAIKSLLPWGDSKVELIDAIDALDIKDIVEFSEIFSSDLEYSDADKVASLRKEKGSSQEADTDIDMLFDNSFGVASFSTLLNEEVAEVEKDLKSEELFADNEKKINNVHIYCIVNDINSYQDYQRLSSNNVILVPEVFNFLNLCQLISLNRLRIEILTEKGEYVSHPNTLKIEVAPNKILVKNDNTNSLVNMSFRGLSRTFEVNLRQMVKASSFYGKVVVSSFNPSMLNQGEKVILGERGLDLTFIRQLIAYDNDFVKLNRRVIFEIRDDQAKGAPTDGYLAAASTVINLLSPDGGYAKMPDSGTNSKIVPDVAEEFVRFKYLKDSSINVTEIDTKNLTHLLKIAWLIGEVIDGKREKDDSNKLVN